MTSGRQRLFPHLLLVVCLVGLLVATSMAAAAAPTRLRVVADEYSLTLSRSAVPNKPVRIRFVNAGGVTHNLRLRRMGGTRTFGIPSTQPGGQRSKTFRLSPGRYNVWCSIASHRALGMETTLRVRR